jgi:predicted RNase H-like HicB family nuclease
MAGTLPHAVFVETDVDDDGTTVAFAGELPGCAATGPDPAAAVVAVPQRVTAFVEWLRSHGLQPVEPVGNWYEVERAAAQRANGAVRRASFTLDELPPSPAELDAWLGWAELAREDLAAALDARPEAVETALWLADQDLALASDLGATPAAESGAGALDRIYAARDVLIDALHDGTGDGARRAIRLAIADDLRMTERLRAE